MTDEKTGADEKTTPAPQKAQSIRRVLADYAARRYLQFKEKYENHGNSEK